MSPLLPQSHPQRRFGVFLKCLFFPSLEKRFSLQEPEIMWRNDASNLQVFAAHRKPQRLTFFQGQNCSTLLSVSPLE